MKFITLVFAGLILSVAAGAEDPVRPNFLIAISDDQSYPHASAYGYEAISTPAFDQIARSGALFHNAFTPAPGCSPMRAAFLTGRQIWQIEQAGTHASSFPTKFETFQDRLETAGYAIGYTGKGWGPGNFRVSGRSRNPAGPSFDRRKIKNPPEGIANTDYAANFDDFLSQRPKGQPFSFWFGGKEPHRSFGRGIGIANGLDPNKVVVPPFLPDTPEIRSDLLDYCYEIQWFDQHLAQMISSLQSAGELRNTMIIVTSDNGMAFPRAKANCYEAGIHMPLAISWPTKMDAAQNIDEPVSLIDVTATIYDASGVSPPSTTPLAGNSLLPRMLSQTDGNGELGDAVFAGRERHSSSRFQSLGYPQRAIRTADFLYIRNFRPRRWPAGAPQQFVLGDHKKPSGKGHEESNLGPMHDAYTDIDACPSLEFLVDHVADPKLSRYLSLAVDRRPSEELFDIQTDPACLNNLADDASFQNAKEELSGRLIDYLSETGDPRVVDADGGDIFETYPRYSKLRWFPTPPWAATNPHRVPKMDWLDEQIPKSLRKQRFPIK